MVSICIRMLQIPFELLEFAFKCFESHLNGSNFHSNALNLVRIVRIPLECLDFVFEGFESLWNV